MVCDNSTGSREAIAFWVLHGAFLLSLHYAQALTSLQMTDKGKALIALRWTLNAIPATVAAYLVYEEEGWGKQGVWLSLHTITMLFSCVYSSVLLETKSLTAMKIHQFAITISYILLGTITAVYGTFERLESGVIYAIVPFTCIIDIVAIRSLKEKFGFKDFDVAVPLFEPEE